MAQGCRLSPIHYLFLFIQTTTKNIYYLHDAVKGYIP